MLFSLCSQEGELQSSSSRDIHVRSTDDKGSKKQLEKSHWTQLSVTERELQAKEISTGV